MVNNSCYLNPPRVENSARISVILALFLESNSYHDAVADDDNDMIYIFYYFIHLTFKKNRNKSE